MGTLPCAGRARDSRIDRRRVTRPRPGLQPTDLLGTRTAPVTVALPFLYAGVGQPVSLPFGAGQRFTYAGAAGLVVEMQVSNATSQTAYSMQGRDGSDRPWAGFRPLNFGVGCPIQRQGGTRFSITGVEPSVSGGRITCGQDVGWGGPPGSYGVLAVGLTDPNNSFGGLLCAPLHASTDVALPVTTDSSGRAGRIDLVLPSGSAPVTFYTQLAIVDAARTSPELPVALSDALRWTITPPRMLERYVVTSPSGSVRFTNVPVLQFN